jgi:ABC-2 family transporter/ABC transporter family protein
VTRPVVSPPGRLPAVECDQITYTFGAHTAVDQLDLRIEPGETFGLLGPNGAGKTTTIRMLVTLLKPMSGRVSVFGVNAAAQPMLVRRLIGYVPQLLSADGVLTGVRSVIQAAVVVLLSAILGVSLTGNPLKLLGTAVVVVLGSAFFSCLSMTIAGLALQRDRLMGIGQAITMPLFFSSSALYPVAVMPGWLEAITRFNPLSYEADALRGLLIGIPTNLALDFGVLIGVTVAGIAAATLLPAWPRADGSFTVAAWRSRSASRTPSGSRPSCCCASICWPAG